MSCKTLTPQSIVDGALVLLGRPPKLLARMGDLYDILGNVLESYRAKMAVHDGNFILKHRTVTLPSGRLEASFVEESWGRPVMCDIDPGSLPARAILPRRDVDLIAIQDMDQYRLNLAHAGASNQLVATDASSFISYAQAVAWLREGNTIKLFFEFGGYVPSLTVQYRFFYEPGGLAQVLEDQDVDWLPEFVGLLQVDFALALLPHSDIAEPKYTRLQNDLEKRFARREPVMDLYLQQDHTEQSGYAGGYRRSRVGGHNRAR